MGHRVTIWNEYRHERDNDVVTEVYPNGIHTVITDALATAGHDVDTATLDENPQHGLTDDLLEKTDVLTW